jgi:hypothetical protein
MYAAEARGEMPKGSAKKWEEHTPKDKKLPEKVSEKKEASVKSHLLAGGAGAALGATGVGYLGLRHGESQRRLGQLQAANYLLSGPHGQTIRNTLLTPKDIESAQNQAQYEENYMARHEEKSAFAVGFEKQALPVVGGLLGRAGKAIQGGAATVGQKAIAGTGAAGKGLMGWGGQLKRTTQSGFLKNVGAGAQRAGQFIAKNPKGVAIGAGIGAGVGAAGLGVKMMGGGQPKQASEKTAFMQGFGKRMMGALTHEDFAHRAEIAGLGILAVPSAAELLPGHDSKKSFWTPKRKAIAEVGGLGILAVPSVAHLAKHFRGY